MLRPDTECILYSDGVYNMFIWALQDSPDAILKEVQWCFRILRYLGAATGFCVNWWRIPVDRKVSPNVFPTRAEVNGGWARRGINEVFIFRLEEWDRVLIHECIHAFSWDVSPSVKVKSCLEKTLGNGEIMESLFEAATELNAEWMWCLIHAPANDSDGKTWLKQMEWQKKQAFAIIARSDKAWKEDTSVFAYYVLKAVLAIDMLDFLLQWLSGAVNTEKWCSVWNDHKTAFIHNAGLNKNTRNQEISMRMTCPDLAQQI